jgi:MFS family permease
VTRHFPPEYPRARAAWLTIAVLFFATLVSTMDRGVINLVVDSVRRDIGASEVQIGLLQGIAFVIFYVTVGLPLGAVADMVPRRRLLAFGIAVWSGATLLGGFAHDFTAMFISRLFVGLGEATLGPCAVSMIADSFPLARRARPMTVYVLGGAVSGGLSTLLTGHVLGWAPWRVAFVAAGGIGLVAAACVLAIAEPERRGLTLAARRGIGLVQAGAYFRDHWRVFLPFYGGVGMFTMGTNSLASWGPSVLIRQFHMAPALAGARLGPVIIAAALAGSAVAWPLVATVVRRRGLNGKLLFAPLIPLLALPSAMAVFAPNAWVAMAAIAEILAVLPIFGATLLGATAELTPKGMKGVAVALYAFSAAIVGATCGPFGVAFLTEHAFGRPDAVGYSIFCVVTPSLILSSVLFWLCHRGYRSAMAGQGQFGAVIKANMERLA